MVVFSRITAIGSYQGYLAHYNVDAMEKMRSDLSTYDTVLTAKFSSKPNAKCDNNEFKNWQIRQDYCV